MTTADIRTERLVLRPLATEDVAELQALFNLEPVRRYLLDGECVDAEWVASVIADSQTAFRERGLGLWRVSEPGSPSPLGLVGFRDFYDPPVEELIYLLHPDAWGRGLAEEMSLAAMEHAFGPAGRTRVRASTDAPNAASLALMRRLGMTETERTPPAEPDGHEQVHSAIEREVWASRRRG